MWTDVTNVLVYGLSPLFITVFEGKGSNKRTNYKGFVKNFRGKNSKKKFEVFNLSSSFVFFSVLLYVFSRPVNTTIPLSKYVPPSLLLQ